jgi:hypothetical protein
MKHTMTSSLTNKTHTQTIKKKKTKHGANLTKPIQTASYIEQK